MNNEWRTSIYETEKRMLIIFKHLYFFVSCSNYIFQKKIRKIIMWEFPCGPVISGSTLEGPGSIPS